MSDQPRVFCIGLHKTGTRSLASLAASLGMRVEHNTRWYSYSDHRPGTLYCDGGGHFSWDRTHEVDYASLAKKYPNSKFMLNTRDDVSWCLSKCLHAGWTTKTRFVRPSGKASPRASEWSTPRRQ